MGQFVILWLKSLLFFLRYVSKITFLYIYSLQIEQGVSTLLTRPVYEYIKTVSKGFFTNPSCQHDFAYLLLKVVQKFNYGSSVGRVGGCRLMRPQVETPENV